MFLGFWGPILSLKQALLWNYVSSKSMEKTTEKRCKKSLAWRAKASLFRGPPSPSPPLCGRAAKAVRVPRVTQRVQITKIIYANANALRIAMQTTAVSARPVSQTQIHFCHVWVDVKLWIFKVQSSVIHNPSGQALYFCTFFQTKLVEFCVCCPRWFLKMTRRNHWRALDSLGKSRTLPLSGSKNWIWNYMENGCFGRKRHGRDFRLQSISRTAVGFPACRETFGTRYLSILNTERERDAPQETWCFSPWCSS